VSRPAQDQSFLPIFDEAPGVRDWPEEKCPICGDERPRFRGMKSKAFGYECVKCGQLFDVLSPSGRPRRGRGGGD
jgi:hypothetical protein